MKLILILLSILIFNETDSKGQSFASIFGDSSTYWTMGWEVFDNYMVVSLRTNGDTIVRNHKYKNIVDQGSNQYGFLREDKLNDKVWFLYRNDTNEYLVMDLNLSVGDSFLLNMPFSTSGLYSTVDSVYMLNNKKHIRLNSKINIASRQENLTFIEGVGANAGFLFQIKNLSPSRQSHILFCSFKNNMPEYRNNLFNGDCFPIIGGITNLNKSSVAWTLFPNPFMNSTLLTFDNSKFNNCSLLIIDNLGRQVEIIENITTGQVTIGKNNLTNGFYIFQLIYDSKIIAAGKMLIN